MYGLVRSSAVRDQTALLGRSSVADIKPPDNIGEGHLTV